ncbi:U3 snoRNP protein [Coemansia aciculifera]|uniref:U3 snoRNP protein n=1 Tax=Coemansia aciculifera TaxID=417176 RepID=A0A9W8M3N5_9FUNG|nr:U3 snoRNP protein [Coemansia aciculifera]KAJ2870498.1 U3 snoRNP protein [Coemansia aciculifera]
MAEVVQYHLEQMVGELEDLERRKLFSKPELKSIVKKRTKFEYGLRRRRVSRADFLRYIEYEINVDALRRKRKHRTAAKDAGGKRTLSDYSIGRRIVSIFERGLTRHPDDVALWLQYIAFVRSSDHSEDGEASTRALSKIYAAAITKHPYEARLWIMAAAHELDASSNGAAARLLLQRALRVSPKDRALWTEYFRLELLLAEKIKARRRVLGIDGQAGEEDEGEDEGEEEESGDGGEKRKRKEENEDAAGLISLPALDEEKEFDQRVEDQAMAKYAAVQAAELSAEQRAALATPGNAYLQGAVAVIVFEQAIKAIPGDWEFRREFASVLARFPDTQAVRQRVLDSIAADFAGSAQARSFLCVAHLAAVSASSPQLVDALREAVGNYGRALRDADTPEMWAEYVRFLAQWRDVSAGEAGEASLRAYFAALLKRAAAQVAEDGAARLSEAVALELADGGLLAEATQRFPASEALWCKRLRAAIAAGDSVERLCEAQALPAAAHARGVWDLWLAWAERSGMAPARVQAKYLAAFARTAQLTSEHAGLKAHLQIRFVDWAWALPASATLHDISHTGEEEEDEEDEEDEGVPCGSAAAGPNVEAFRRACQSVQRHAFPTPGFYRRCLELEPDARHKTTLHEFACRVNESDTRPWLAYLQFLVDERRLDSAAAVFWRASKALPTDDAREAFDALYQELLRKK